MKVKFFTGFCLLTVAFFSFAQEIYHLQGQTKTVRHPSWKKRQFLPPPPPPRRQLKEGILLPPSTAGDLVTGNDRATQRRNKAKDSAYGKVKWEEYSPREKALVLSLKKIHNAQKTILQLAGKEPVKAEKALELIRKELKNLQPTLRAVKDFPCRLILDNPRELVRESRRLSLLPKGNDLQYLSGMQVRQEQQLKRHIENGIRARRSLK